MLIDQNVLKSVNVSHESNMQRLDKTNRWYQLISEKVTAS